MLRDLLDRRARITTEMRSIISNPGNGTDLTAEQSVSFDKLKGELEQVEQTITRATALEDAERRMQGQPVGSGDGNLDRELRNYSLVRAIASQAGIHGVDAGRERELSAELARRSGRAFQGMAVPVSVFHQPVEQRVLTTAAPAGGPGGNLIQTTVDGSQFIDRLRAALVVRRLGARVLTGLVGNLDIPALKASATTGWVAENAALTPSDHQFRKVSLTPKHCGALTELSRNMLQQPSVDVENLVRADFAAVLAEAVDRAAINGSGTGAEPRGILQTSGIGSVDMATPTWAKVLEFISDVEAADSMGTGWATNPKVVKLLRSTLKETGDAGAGYLMDGPGELAGYTAISSNVVPSTLGTAPENNKAALIFGNWSDLLLGYWSEFDLLVNPYEATAYSKGNVQVRGLLTCDIAVRHPASFSAATNIAAG